MAPYRIPQIEDYEPFIGIENVERIREKARKLKGLRVANFNSTYYGGGVLLKVMARGPFEEGQQCWILDRDGSKIGATVENVFKQTIDSEVTLSTVLPA